LQNCFPADNELLETGEEKGRQENKIENAINLLDLLDDQTISERIGPPLEGVQELRSTHT